MNSVVDHFLILTTGMNAHLDGKQAEFLYISSKTLILCFISCH